MGKGDSDSKTTQKQTSHTTTGVTENSFGIGAEDNVAISVSGIDSIGDVELQISEQGLKSEDVVSIVNAISGGAADLVKQTAEKISEAGRPVADIARSTTGTESELGRLANKYALPALGGLLVLGYWKSQKPKRRRKR